MSEIQQIIPSHVQFISVVDLQHGDTGKWKVAYDLRWLVDISVATNGWRNAGHNIVYNGKKEHFHELPWSAASVSTVYLSPWRVIHIPSLSQEIEKLTQMTWKKAHIVIAGGAQVVVDSLHTEIDKLLELGTWNKIGTTLKWIWPAYALKALRKGVSIWEMMFSNVVQERWENISWIFPWLNQHQIQQEFDESKKILHRLIEDWIVEIDIHDSFLDLALSDSTKKAVVETSQSVLLWLSAGAYPFCTSSEIGFHMIHSQTWVNKPMYKIWVVKAIVSKVWWWRFPTRWQEAGVWDDVIARYRQEAGEFGATTGRPRDIGYIDAVGIRHAFRISWTPDLLRINMGDMLQFLSQNGVKNKIAVWYMVKNPATWDIETILDVIPPHYQEITEVIYENLPDIISYKDYPVYIEKLKQILWFEWKIVLWTGPRSEEYVIF